MKLFKAATTMPSRLSRQTSRQRSVLGVEGPSAARLLAALVAMHVRAGLRNAVIVRVRANQFGAFQRFHVVQDPERRAFPATCPLAKT